VRQALQIAARELRATYASAFGLGAAAGFVALSGILLVVDLRSNQAVLNSWFSALYVLSGLLAALLGMRSFAEEERAGTLELLLTAPVAPWRVTMGKLLGSAGVLVALSLPTVVCPLLIASMGNPDLGPILTGYVGMVVVGLAFVSLAQAVSASTGSPLVAATGAAALLVALWFSALVANGTGGRLGFVLQYLSPSHHVVGFLRGTLGVSDLTYFLSLVVFGFGMTLRVLEVRR